MPPRKRPVNGNPTASNNEHTGPLDDNIPNPTMQNQLQQKMKAMIDQQRQANENHARLQAQANENQAILQEQMAKKDEDHKREMAQMQR